MSTAFQERWLPTIGVHTICEKMEQLGYDSPDEGFFWRLA